MTDEKSASEVENASSADDERSTKEGDSQPSVSEGDREARSASPEDGRQAQPASPEQASDQDVDRESRATPQSPDDKDTGQEADAPAESDDDSRDEPSHSELEQLVRQMREEVETLETKLADLKRRNDHEHEEIKKYAVTDMAEEMLKVRDMLADSIEMQELDEQTERRLGMVLKQFDKTLTAGRISKIQPEKGDEYDSRRHRLMKKKSVDGYEPGQIVYVSEPGYRAQDRVLRSARVIVAAE